MNRFLILGLSLAIVVIGCSSRGDLTTFRWGGDASGGEPFIIERDGEPPGGFEGEIAQYLGQKIGRTPVFVQRSWPNLPQDLQRGDIDAAFNGMEWMPNREEAMASTIPYFMYGLRLVVREDSPVQSWDDLRRKQGQPKIRVGVLKDTAAERYLQSEYAEDVEIEGFDEEGTTGVMKRVVANPNYVTVQDAPAAVWYLKYSREQAEFSRLRIVDSIVRPSEHPYYVIYVRKEDTALRVALNDAIREGLRDGTFRKIYEKYGLWDDDQKRILEAGEDWPPIQASEKPAITYFAWQMVMASRFTIALAVLSFPLAMALGLLLALGRIYGPWIVRAVSVTYIEIFRGTPLLLQLAVIYYFLPSIGINLSAFMAGVLGLALNYAANEAEVFRSGLLAVPRGQSEAALSLGMSPVTTLWRIVLPQAWRMVVPPITNDFIALFKDTAVCSAIAVTELTARYRGFVVNNPSRVIELGILAAVLYLLMSYPLSLLARRLEARQARGNVAV
jgi:polar amino acid transport system substrate-binding protein